MFSIFGLTFGALFLGLALAIWMTRNKPPSEAGMVIPEEDAQEDPKEIPALTMDDLHKVANAMCEKNKLTIQEKVVESDSEQYWVLHSENPIYGGNFVLAFHEDTPDKPYVNMAQLLAFKDFVKSLKGSQGLFFTTGYFTREVHQPLEGVKVGLYNRLKILKELGRLA